MTPDEKKLYALMAVAEQQQNLVNQAVKELQITEERIQKVIAGQTRLRQLDHVFVTPDLAPCVETAWADNACPASDHHPLHVRLAL